VIGFVVCPSLRGWVRAAEGKDCADVYKNNSNSCTDAVALMLDRLYGGDNNDPAEQAGTSFRDRPTSAADRSGISTGQDFLPPDAVCCYGDAAV